MTRSVRKELALFPGLAAVLLLRAGEPMWFLGLAALATFLLLWPSIRSYHGQGVIITGGSRGLGLALAERFLKEGANVALLARDEEELERARTLLHDRAGSGCEIYPIVADVTHPEELREALDKARRCLRRVDILVNNAGSITVGDFEWTERKDFDALLELEVHAVVDSVRAVVPWFRAAGSGTIVNISSIGGKLGVPHLASYCAAKFALAGLSGAVGADLAADGIHVMAVFPGPMRTGSTVQIQLRGNHPKEYAWFTAADLLPFISVSPESAARRILRGISNGNAEIIFPMSARLAVMLRNLFPELFTWILRLSGRFFPTGGSPGLKTGRESKAWLEGRPWFQPLRARSDHAEIHFNQTKRSRIP
jgi:short-subunit dehydrogenase